ncbi:O-methyltransferase [Streptomyces polyrhachis]|uniref:O-methyltransferase n=1 Tax=Streptomyces polyrhachis TaxID=1282885 RepID=A0ABW2GK50_9ACTN
MESGAGGAITGNRQANWSFAEAYGAAGATRPAQSASPVGPSGPAAAPPAAGATTSAAAPERATVATALLWARQRARETGVTATSDGTGAALRLLAAAADAKAVVEIGTGTGVSGLQLLQGMRPDGVLTTMDPDPELQQFARQAFQAAGFAPNRARIIAGRALDVLPRLADGGYDMVFADGDPWESVEYFAESLRLLRTGGLVCFAGVFAEGRTVDPAVHRGEVLKLRELLRTVKESQILLPALLPVGDGLLCAIKR